MKIDILSDLHFDYYFKEFNNSKKDVKKLYDDYLNYRYPNGNFPLKSNNEMWKNCMFDFEMIKGIENFNDLYHIELPKIEAVYKECDVMITHINPSFQDEHLSKEFFQQQTNTFFCFNGHEYMRSGTMKYWIFGHTHDSIEYEFEGVKCMCNAFDFLNKSGKSFEIIRKERLEY